MARSGVAHGLLSLLLLAALALPTTAQLGGLAVSLSFETQTSACPTSPCVSAGYNGIFDVNGFLAVASRDTDAGDNCVSLLGSFSGTVTSQGLSGQILAAGTDGSTFTGIISSSTMTISPDELDSCAYVFQIGPVDGDTAYGLGSLDCSSGCDGDPCLSAGYWALYDLAGNVAFVSRYETPYGSEQEGGPQCSSYLGVASQGSTPDQGTLTATYECYPSSKGADGESQCVALPPSGAGSITAEYDDEFVTISVVYGPSQGFTAGFSRSTSVTTQTGGSSGSPYTVTGLPWPGTQNACAASSPSYCYAGYSTGTNYSMVYAISTSTFVPSSDGAACSCVSYVYTSKPGEVQYSPMDAATLSYLQSSSQSFTNVRQCTSNLCNCGSSCTSPFTTCPTAGASGPLQCRVGAVGTIYDEESGASVSVTPNTYGNLASMTAPAGSMCLSATFNGTTQYFYGSVKACVSIAGAMSPYTGVTACKTNNCGAPPPTWPQCPATQTATSCYIGATGPAAAVTAIGQLAGFTNPTPVATTVPAGACLSGVATCASLVAAKLVTAAQCPTGQSVTAYLNGLADNPAGFSGDSCTSVAQTLNSLGAASIVACGSNNCNAPSTTTYLSATATLTGYTAASFGTAQATAFSSAMAASLQVPPVSVIVTGVTDVAVAGRHLLATSVAVSFAVAATTSTLANVTAALATPPTVAALQAAGLAACSGVSVSAPTGSGSTVAPVVATNLPTTTVTFYVSVGLTLTGYTTSTFTTAQASQLNSFLSTMFTNLWNVTIPITTTNVAASGSGAVAVTLGMAPPSAYVLPVQGFFTSAQVASFPQLFAAVTPKILTACTAASISTPASTVSTAPVAYVFTSAANTGSGAAADDVGTRCYLATTSLWPGATTQCDNGVHTCAKDYSCVKVTDNSCSPSNCLLCRASETYYSCASSATSSAVAVLKPVAGLVAAALLAFLL